MNTAESPGGVELERVRRRISTVSLLDTRGVIKRVRKRLDHAMAIGAGKYDPDRFVLITGRHLIEIGGAAPVTSWLMGSPSGAGTKAPV